MEIEALSKLRRSAMVKEHAAFQWFFGFYGMYKWKKSLGKAKVYPTDVQSKQS